MGWSGLLLCPLPWNKMPFPSACLPVVVDPRVRFIQHFRILRPSTSHMRFSCFFLSSSPAPPSAAAFLSTVSPIFLLLHFPPFSLPSSPYLSCSSEAAFRQFNVSNHPGPAAHRYTTGAKPSTTKSCGDQGALICCATCFLGWLLRLSRTAGSFYFLVRYHLMHTSTSPPRCNLVACCAVISRLMRGDTHRYLTPSTYL